MAAPDGSCSHLGWRDQIEAVSREQLVQHPDGSTRALGLFDIFTAPGEQHQSAGIRADGFWEAWQTRYLSSIFRPGLSVWHLGANVGYYALLSARLVGPEGYVLAVEPHPRLADLLRRSAAKNGYDWMHIEACAVVGAAQAGDALLRVSPGYSCFGTLLGDVAIERSLHETHTVPTCLLTSLLASHRAPRVIMADIEGSEQVAFEAAHDWLAAALPAVFTEWSWMFQDGPGFARFWESLGYEAQRLTHDGIALPVSLRQIAQQCVEAHASGNEDDSWCNLLLIPPLS